MAGARTCVVFSRRFTFEGVLVLVPSVFIVVVASRYGRDEGTQNLVWLTILSFVFLGLCMLFCLAFVGYKIEWTLYEEGPLETRRTVWGIPFGKETCMLRRPPECTISSVRIRSGMQYTVRLATCDSLAGVSIGKFDLEAEALDCKRQVEEFYLGVREQGR